MHRCVLGRATSALRAIRSSTATSARMVRYDAFADRHIGPSRLEKQQMLDFLGFTTLDELTDTNVPNQISPRALKMENSKMLGQRTVFLFCMENVVDSDQLPGLVFQ
ncbi:unnamed protein product [Heligmosomoides polygyrus]|uniref:Aspartate carbamoyltransferase n=1 Tax=Heligmosomoides polygyrus TaxID=6339 RepID=A0A183F7G8_HELPZ|nr:unnamed protein product [Heligmosomoides polygyrus]